jgi:murein DD-endopeptidase MepM/ murein hydrolase activator NlpD
VLRTASAPRHQKRRPNAAAQVVTAPRLIAGVGVATTIPTVAGTALAPAADATVNSSAHVATTAAAAPVRTTVVKSAVTPRVTWLVYGSTGSLVRIAQQRLGGLVVDGQFGNATRAKVRAFQSANQLYVDGKIGPVTWEALGGYPGATGVPVTCQVTTLRYGASGTLVKNAQQKLGGIAVDGDFGPSTLARVRAYQQTKGLPVTGAVDPATWRALGGECTAANKPPTTTQPPVTPPPVTPPPVVGDPNGPYRMPWDKGVTYKITQGPHGSYSHDDKYDLDGIDFGMPSGTQVTASRGGVVYDTGYVASGGNYVKIKDASGLCQVYFHLSSYQVVAGQSVSQGQDIAKSGNTGNSTGAHLHFQLISCTTWLTAGVPDTVERGTSYPTGVYVTSQNG